MTGSWTLKLKCIPAVDKGQKRKNLGMVCPRSNASGKSGFNPQKTEKEMEKDWDWPSPNEPLAAIRALIKKMEDWFWHHIKCDKDVILSLKYCAVFFIKTRECHQIRNRIRLPNPQTFCKMAFLFFWLLLLIAWLPLTFLTELTVLRNISII